MFYKDYIYFALFLVAVATASPVWSQQSADNLPDVDELLDRAIEQIALLDKEYAKPHRYRRAAVLYGRSGDVEATFDAIEHISGQERENAKRLRYLKIVADVSQKRNALPAIKIVDEAPAAYGPYSDDAYGRIAVTASQEGDAAGAWLAISRINQVEGLYPYGLVAAAILDDKVRGREILLGEHKSRLDALAGRVQLAREEWLGIVWILSYYKWCGLEKESEELIQHACATTDEPEKARAEVISRLEGEPPCVSKDTKETSSKKPIAVEDIRTMHAAANRSGDPREKVNLLLNVAELVLEYGKQP